jgi:hypothetical protein
MVVITPQVQESTTVEQWFYAQTTSLKLLAPCLDLSTVQGVLEQYLPGRVQRFSRHISEPLDASNWLKIILKSGELIRLWPTPEQSVTIAVNCSGNLKLAQEQFALIQSAEFSSARHALGIDRHWFLVISGYPLQVPKQSELLDALYTQLVQGDECVIVGLGTAL